MNVGTRDHNIQATYLETAKEGISPDYHTPGSPTSSPAGGNNNDSVVTAGDMDTEYVAKINVLENLNNMNRTELKRNGHTFSQFVSYCNWKGMKCHTG